MSFRTYTVSRQAKGPLLEFMLTGLRKAGCSIIRVSSLELAPYQITFENSTGERMGIVAYAFFANSVVTRNRPTDEHRFQIKYGAKDGQLHTLWQDPLGLYTTLFLGINAELGFFVGADPVLNNPTKFFISKEFKQEQVDRILANGWHSWEREQLPGRHHEPIEVMVGGTIDNFLRYVLFEREAGGEDQGHRQLLAEHFGKASIIGPSPAAVSLALPIAAPARIHELEKEFQLSPQEILDLIGAAPRLKMAVRGWVAQRHLVHQLEKLPEVVECQEIHGEGQPDVHVRLNSGRPVLIECKNVLRKSYKGHPRMDFMRTRASQADPCTRYYLPSDFQVVAACLHAQLEQWVFRYRLTSKMKEHQKCPGRLEHRVSVDELWSTEPLAVIRAASLEG